MFKNIGRLVLISISFLVSVTSYAQGLGNSPYSRIGIGDVVNYKGSVRNMGMGYAGSVLGSKEYMNLLNPAGLANFKNRYKDSLVKIDVGYNIQYKTFKIGDNTSEAWGANINYLAFMFPVSKVFSTSLVLTPATTVQNKYTYTDSIANDPNKYTAVYANQGNGGIYQLQWANGVGITEHLSVGLTTNFNFGSISQETTSQIISDPANPGKENVYGISTKTSYSGVSFKPGLIYNKQLFKSTRFVDTLLRPSTGITDSIAKRTTRKSTGIFLNAGGTAEFSGTTKSTQTRDLFTRNANNTNVRDSVLSSIHAPSYLPVVYRAGFALEKPQYWAVAMDLSYSDWSGFDKNKFKSDSLSTASYSLFMGGEYYTFNERRPAKSKTYRAGFTYSATPIIISGYRVYDYSFSVGASIPVGTRINQKGIPILPKVNVAFVVGQRTSAGTDQLSETYYRLHLGMVIYDKWFTRRKIQ